jgi:hypothetical protein
MANPFSPSPEFIQQLGNYASHAVEDSISPMQNFLNSFDLTNPNEIELAHTVLDMIKDLQTLQSRIDGIISERVERART